MLKLQEAIDSLYRIAIAEGRKQSPKRLNLLADFCVQELGNRGLQGRRRRYRSQESAEPKIGMWHGLMKGKCVLASVSSQFCLTFLEPFRIVRMI